MDKKLELIKYSKGLLNDCNIATSNKESVGKKLAFYIETLIYNIVSIACTISLLIYNSSKLNKNCIKQVKNHIEKTCKIKYPKISQKGGNVVLPGEYFGNDSGLYNSNADNKFESVDFINGIAKQQLGGCKNCYIGNNNKIINIYINYILKEHKVSANSEIKKELLNLVKYHLKLLTKILMKEQFKNKITPENLNKFIKKNKKNCNIKKIFL